jgi:transposase
VNSYRILKEIRQLRKDHTMIQLLDTVSGIGCVTAFCLYAELIDISRFRNFDALASFVGLVPSTRSTSDTELSNTLTKRHARYLRNLLIEAAWRAVRQDPAMTFCYQEYCRRMIKQDAIIRIAKKLLKRIRHVWKNQKPYIMGVVE